MLAGWKEVCLGDVINIKHGYGFKGIYFIEEPSVNVLVTPGNFTIGGGFKSNKLKYYKGPIPEEFILSPNDVIVTMTDLSKQADTLGFSAKVPKDRKYTYLLNQRIGLVSLKSDEYNIDFIYWLLRTDVYQKYIAGSSSGATVKHTSPKKIYSAKLKVPKSKETQKKIAKILSNYDDLIENNLKRIKLLEEKAQQTYEEWFVRMKFPNHENTPIDKTTGLPLGWKKDCFIDNLDFKTGKLDSNALDNDGVYDFYTCAKEIYRTNTYCFEGEAVLLGGNNATGDFSLFYGNDKFDAYQRTYIVTSSVLPLVYVYHYLRMYLPYFKIVSSGASTKFLTMKILNKTKLLIPSRKVLNKYQEIIKPCFDLKLKLRDENQKLKEARDILLPRLMTGIIDVNKIEM